MSMGQQPSLVHLDGRDKRLATRANRALPCGDHRRVQLVVSLAERRLSSAQASRWSAATGVIKRHGIRCESGSAFVAITVVYLWCVWCGELAGDLSSAQAPRWLAATGRDKRLATRANRALPCGDHPSCTLRFSGGEPARDCQALGRLACRLTTGVINGWHPVRIRLCRVAITVAYLAVSLVRKGRLAIVKRESASPAARDGRDKRLATGANPVCCVAITVTAPTRGSSLCPQMRTLKALDYRYARYNGSRRWSESAGGSVERVTTSDHNLDSKTIDIHVTTALTGGLKAPAGVSNVPTADQDPTLQRLSLVV